MLCAACDPTRYRLLGVDGWHPSCQENLQRTMAALGHGTIEVPQPINLFMAVGVQADGAFTWSAAPTGAGLLSNASPLSPPTPHRLDADLVAAGLDRLLGVPHPEGVGHQVLERVDLRVSRQERQ